MSKDINVLSEVGLFVAGVLAASWLANRGRESAAPTGAPAPAAPARTPDT